MPKGSKPSSLFSKIGLTGGDKKKDLKPSGVNINSISSPNPTIASPPSQASSAGFQLSPNQQQYPSRGENGIPYKPSESSPQHPQQPVIPQPYASPNGLQHIYGQQPQPGYPGSPYNYPQYGAVPPNTAQYPPVGAQQLYSPPLGQQPFSPAYTNVSAGATSPPPAPNHVPANQRPSGERSPADIFQSHGEALSKREEYNGAVGMFNQAIMFNPGSATLLASRSYAYMLASPPNFDAAMRDAESAIQLDPTYYRGWLQQGEVRLRSGNIQGALDAFSVAMDFAHGEDKDLATWSMEHAKDVLAKEPPMSQQLMAQGQQPGQNQAGQYGPSAGAQGGYPQAQGFNMGQYGGAPQPPANLQDQTYVLQPPLHPENSKLWEAHQERLHQQQEQHYLREQQRKAAQQMGLLRLHHANLERQQEQQQQQAHQQQQQQQQHGNIGHQRMDSAASQASQISQASQASEASNASRASQKTAKSKASGGEPTPSQTPSPQPPAPTSPPAQQSPFPPQTRINASLPPNIQQERQQQLVSPPLHSPPQAQTSRQQRPAQINLPPPASAFALGQGKLSPPAKSPRSPPAQYSIFPKEQQLGPPSPRLPPPQNSQQPQGRLSPTPQHSRAPSSLQNQTQNGVAPSTLQLDRQPSPPKLSPPPQLGDLKFSPWQQDKSPVWPGQYSPQPPSTPKPPTPLGVKEGTKSPQTIVPLNGSTSPQIHPPPSSPPPTSPPPPIPGFARDRSTSPAAQATPPSEEDSPTPAQAPEEKQRVELLAERPPIARRRQSYDASTDSDLSLDDVDDEVPEISFATQISRNPSLAASSQALPSPAEPMPHHNHYWSKALAQQAQKLARDSAQPQLYKVSSITSSPSISAKSDPSEGFVSPFKPEHPKPNAGPTSAPTSAPGTSVLHASKKPGVVTPPNVSPVVDRFPNSHGRKPSIVMIPPKQASPKATSPATSPSMLSPGQQPAHPSPRNPQPPTGKKPTISIANGQLTPDIKTPAFRPVQRYHDASTVSRSAVSSLPFGMSQCVNAVAQPNGNNAGVGRRPSSIPNNRRALSTEALNNSLNILGQLLSQKNQGSLSIRPYTAAGNIDAVRLFYVGLTQSQLTAREIRTPSYLHPSFRAMAVDTIKYPGNTFLDMDCESSGYYEGKWPGTVGISGYSEEYREYQLSINPLQNLALEGTRTLPVIPLDRIVQRIRALIAAPFDEDAESLRQELGLSQFTSLQSGVYNDPISAHRQSQIESICLGLNRSVFENPETFVDFAKTRNISNHTLGGLKQGVGLHNFLYQVLLGAELLVRLKKEPITTSYSGLITDSVSGLLVLADLWKQNVTINGPNPLPKNLDGMQMVPYTLYSRVHQKQADGLIQFAAAIGWPLFDEARQYIENAYNDLTSGKLIGYDICDWLFGLILPGKILRHRIMCCLVYATPSVRHLTPAAYFDDGLVVRGRSFWPKRSVLGRVLGAVSNVKSVCGWIGPLPAPVGTPDGWVRIATERTEVPVPCDPSIDPLDYLCFNDKEGEKMTTDQIIASLIEPTEWSQRGPAPRPAHDKSITHIDKITLEPVSLLERPQAASDNTPASPTSPDREFHAHITFLINASPVTFHLLTIPLFVTPHPCVGTHHLHRKQAFMYLSNGVKVSNLKNTPSDPSQFLLIDALGEGEEVVARAWCSEKGRHAVIRRGGRRDEPGETCFACAAHMAGARSGLGFNVLIWAKGSGTKEER